MPTSDADIVRRSRAGDGQAFADLVSRYTGLVHATILATIHDRDAAEDLAQDTFCRAYESIGDLRQPERLGPWLGQMARRTALGWRRREHQRLPVELAGDPVASRTSLPADQDLVERGTRGALWEALDRLDAEDRQLVLLRHVEDCSYREIGRFLGIPAATAFFRLRRCERHLGQDLARRLGEEQALGAADRARLRNRVVAALDLPAQRPEPATHLAAEARPEILHHMAEENLARPAVSEELELVRLSDFARPGAARGIARTRLGVEARVAGDLTRDRFLHPSRLEYPVHFVFGGGAVLNPVDGLQVEVVPKELEQLRRYLAGGGLLYLEGTGPFLAQMAAALRQIAPPGSRLAQVPFDHPPYRAAYPFGSGFRARAAGPRHRLARNGTTPLRAARPTGTRSSIPTCPGTCGGSSRRAR
ncbi:MAG: sigma-70 family RNA polymerase sigma factor [Gemmatimonadota bacterium]